MQLGVAGPRLGAVEVVAQQPQEERDRFRPRRSGCEGARHLPKTIIQQAREGGGRGLVRCDGAREGFLEKVYSQPGIQSVELMPSWLTSLQIMRISDVEALTERVSCSSAPEGLIEEGKGRT